MKKSRKNVLKTSSADKKIGQNVKNIGSILLSFGFKLESYQPHIMGERKIKSLSKIVLIGRKLKDNSRVVIKTSDQKEDKKKINQERKIRQELENISSITKGLYIPKEIFYGQKGKFTFFITEFINQDKILVAHGLNDQFAMIKHAIEGQESLDLASFRKIKGKTCPVITQNNYLGELIKHINFINNSYRDSELSNTLTATRKIFKNNMVLIAKHCGYLVHDDFCPHNFRINSGKLYFIDYTAAKFGNKYETWARLLNYMTLHNPALDKKITSYLKDNRSFEDVESLRLFRIYKTVFLIMYYIKTLNKTSGNLLKLTRIRINFWHNFLKKLLENKSISKADLNRYRDQRDSLRSGDEKKRQKEFAVA